MTEEVQLVVKIPRQLRNDLKKRAIDEDVLLKDLVEKIFKGYLYNN